MYQIKYSDGYEIQVVGKGDKGLCRVRKSTSTVQHDAFAGTYDECCQWLADRGMHEVGGNTHSTRQH